MKFNRVITITEAQSLYSNFIVAPIKSRFLLYPRPHTSLPSHLDPFIVSRTTPFRPGQKNNYVAINHLEDFLNTSIGRQFLTALNLPYNAKISIFFGNYVRHPDPTKCGYAFNIRRPASARHAQLLVDHSTINTATFSVLSSFSITTNASQGLDVFVIELDSIPAPMQPAIRQVIHNADQIYLH